MPSDGLKEIAGVCRHSPKFKLAKSAVLVGNRFTAMRHANHRVDRLRDPIMKTQLILSRNITAGQHLLGKHERV